MVTVSLCYFKMFTNRYIQAFLSSNILVFVQFMEV